MVGVYTFLSPMGVARDGNYEMHPLCVCDHKYVPRFL